MLVFDHMDPSIPSIHLNLRLRRKKDVNSIKYRDLLSDDIAALPRIYPIEHAQKFSQPGARGIFHATKWVNDRQFLSVGNDSYIRYWDVSVSSESPGYVQSSKTTQSTISHSPLISETRHNSSIYCMDFTRPYEIWTGGLDRFICTTFRTPNGFTAGRRYIQCDTQIDGIACKRDSGVCYAAGGNVILVDSRTHRVIKPLAHLKYKNWKNIAINPTRLEYALCERFNPVVQLFDMRTHKKIINLVPAHLVTSQVVPSSVSYNKKGIVAVTYKNESTYTFESTKVQSHDPIVLATATENWSEREKLLRQRNTLYDNTLANYDKYRKNGIQPKIPLKLQEHCGPEGFRCEPFIKFAAHCNLHSEFKKCTFVESRVLCPSDCGRVFSYRGDGSLETVLEGGHREVLNSVSWNKKFGEILTSGNDNFIYLWRLIQKKEEIDDTPYYEDVRGTAVLQRRERL